MTKLQYRSNPTPAWNVEFRSSGEGTEYVTSLLPLSASCEIMKHIVGHGRGTCITIQNGAAMFSTEVPCAVACHMYESALRLGIPVNCR
jgi:hypothetical protein